MAKREKAGRTSGMAATNKKHRAAFKQKESGKKGSAFKTSKSSSNPNRPDPSGGKKGSQFRSKSTINRINMYRSKPNKTKMKKAPTSAEAGKVHPDRRWFGNVRVADQKDLDRYRKTLEEGEKKKGSGFQVLVKQKKLPLSLVRENYDKTLTAGDRLLQVQSF